MAASLTFSDEPHSLRSSSFPFRKSLFPVYPRFPPLPPSSSTYNDWGCYLKCHGSVNHLLVWTVQSSFFYLSENPFYQLTLFFIATVIVSMPLLWIISSVPVSLAFSASQVIFGDLYPFPGLILGNRTLSPGRWNGGLISRIFSTSSRRWWCSVIEV